jgi:hypothetical protein
VANSPSEVIGQHLSLVQLETNDTTSWIRHEDHNDGSLHSLLRSDLNDVIEHCQQNPNLSQRDRAALMRSRLPDRAIRLSLNGSVLS